MLASDDVVRPRCAGGAGVLLTALRPTVQVAITLTALHAQTRRSGVVTKAGADGRTIVEIDGRPAASVYDEWSDGALGAKAALGSESDVGGACNILSESTLYPLAREIQDGDGLRVHHLLHPAFTYPDGSLDVCRRARGRDAADDASQGGGSSPPSAAPRRRRSRGRGPASSGRAALW